MVVMAGAQRLTTVCRSILQVLLGNKINVMIIEKALTLELSHFEDAEYYDKLLRARREASSRPLGPGRQDLRSDARHDRPARDRRLAVPVLAMGRGIAGVHRLAGLCRRSRDSPARAFRIMRRRSPERRMQFYLEMVLTREDGVKEVKLLQLGKLFLRRYVDIFRNIYREDRNLVLRRNFWGYLLGLLSSAAFYFAYGWVGFSAIAGAITIGQMTAYIAQFRLGPEFGQQQPDRGQRHVRGQSLPVDPDRVSRTRSARTYRRPVAGSRPRRRRALRKRQLHLSGQRQAGARQRQPAHPARRAPRHRRRERQRQDHADQVAGPAVCAVRGPPSRSKDWNFRNGISKRCGARSA